MPEYEFIREDIFTVEDFFSAAECEAHIARAEAKGFRDAPIISSQGPVMRPDIRNNTRVIIDDETLAKELWPRITDYVPRQIDEWMACGVNERFRFYRYDIDEQFDWHFDAPYERWNGERSQLTFMIYLNEGFEGGATSLEEVTVTPKRGLALFFRHKILHKGQPVTVGRKYVLRTDVMYRPTREPA